MFGSLEKYFSSSFLHLVGVFIQGGGVEEFVSEKVIDDDQMTSTSDDDNFTSAAEASPQLLESGD